MPFFKRQMERLNRVLIHYGWKRIQTLLRTLGTDTKKNGGSLSLGSLRSTVRLRHLWGGVLSRRLSCLLWTGLESY